jgi:hypothetical protein
VLDDRPVVEPGDVDAGVLHDPLRDARGRADEVAAREQVVSGG